MLKRNPQMKVTPKEVPPRLLPLQITWDKILLALGLGEKGDKFLDQTEKKVSDLKAEEVLDQTAFETNPQLWMQSMSSWQFTWVCLNLRGKQLVTILRECLKAASLKGLTAWMGGNFVLVSFWSSFSSPACSICEQRQTMGTVSYSTQCFWGTNRQTLLCQGPRMDSAWF